MTEKLYEKFFNKEEIPKVEEKIKNDEDFKKKFEKIKKEQIDDSLDTLELRMNRVLKNKTEKNFEDRFEAFKKTVLDLEEKQQKSIEKTGEVLKEKKEKELKEKLEKKKDELDKSLREQANKKIPFIGEFLYDWAKDLSKPVDKNAGFFEKVFGKIGVTIGMAILGMLGVKKGVEEIQNLKEEDFKVNLGGVVENQSKGSEEEKSEGGEGKEEGKSSRETSKEDVEKLKKIALSKTGFTILKGLSGVEFKEENNSVTIFNKIKDKSQREIQEILNKCIDSDGKVIDSEVQKLRGLYGINKEISPKEIFNTLSAFSNRYVNIIYKQRLNPGRLKEMFVGKDGKIIDKYKELFNPEQTQKLENGKLDFRELSLEKITILMSLSLSSIFIAGLGKLKQLGVDFLNFLVEDSDFPEELKKDLEERKNNLIPKEFYTKLSLVFTGNQSLNISIEKLERNKDFKALDEEKKEKIKRFIDFKDKFIEEIGKNKVFNLGIPSFKEKLLKKINLGELIFLYTSIDGKLENIENDVINKSLYYSWLLKISESNNLKNQFNGEITKELYKNIIEQNNEEIFSKEDKDILVVVLGKTLGITLGTREKIISKGINIVSMPLATELEKQFDISKENSLMIATAIEGGLAFFIGYLLRKSYFGRFLIMSGVLFPTMQYLVSKFGTKGIKEKIGEDMYKELNKFVKGGNIKIKVDGKEKEVSVNSLDDIEKATQNPKDYLKEVEKVGEYEKDGVKFYTRKFEPLLVEYNGVEYVLDIGPVFYDNNEKEDTYEGKTISMTTVKLDRDKKYVIIGNGDNFIKISIDLIIKKLKEGDIKSFDTINGEKKYIVISGNDNGDYIQDNIILMQK